MQRRFLYISLNLLLALIFSPTIQAQPHNEPYNFTLKQLIDIGLRQSGRIKKSKAELSIAESRTREAIGAAFPNVKLKAAATQNDDEYYRAYAEATQPLYTGGALTAGYRLGLQNEELQKLNHEKETQRYLSDLVAGYLEVVYANQLLDASLENYEILKRHADVIAKYEKIGRARRSDLLVSKVNLRTAETNIERQRSALDTTIESLRALVEIEFPPKITEKNLAAYYPSPIPEGDKAVSLAFQNSPSLKMTRLAQDIIQSEKKLALAEDLPNLSLTGQSGYRNRLRDDLFENDAKYSSLTLNLTIPIFSGLTSMAKRRTFEEQKTSAISTYEVQKFELEAALRAKLAEIKIFQQQLPTVEASAADAREALRLAERDYMNNLISSQDVISIQRTRLEALNLLLQTQHDFALSLLKTHELMGADLERVYARK